MQTAGTLLLLLKSWSGPVQNVTGHCLTGVNKDIPKKTLSGQQHSVCCVKILPFTIIHAVTDVQDIHDNTNPQRAGLNFAVWAGDNLDGFL